MINYTTGSTIQFGPGAKAVHQLERLFETLTYDVTEPVSTAIAQCEHGGLISISVTIREKEHA